MPVRESQLLPTVKCSSCGRLVAFNELGEHICAAVPAVPSLPRPALSQATANSLLPPRLQGRVGSPPSSSAPRSPSKLNPRVDTGSPAPRTAATSPLRSSPLRNRSGSSASSQSLPTNPRSAQRPELDPPPSSWQDSYLPPPPRAQEPDTFSGGEAGLAGVGRRGFAAAARAALFTIPTQNNHQQDYHSHDPQPPYIDVDTRSAGTPPLSPGSGYSSSHSPGPPSPVPQYQDPAFPTKVSRSPSPIYQQDPAEAPTSGSAFARIPFFEKYKNKLPTALANLAGTGPTDQPDSPEEDRTARPAVDSPRRTATKSSTRSYGTSVSSPTTATSEVGLAYADSDEEDNVDPYHDEDVVRGAKALANRSPPTNGTSILRSKTETSNGSSRIHFPTLSDRESHRRDNSDGSSYSSHSSVGDGQPKKIANALGLSRKNVNEYGKIGGPGEAGLKRNISGSSDGSRSAYSRTTSHAGGPGGVTEEDVMSREMRPRLGPIRTPETDGDGPGARRNNTIQSPSSPEARTHKLPIRANTTDVDQSRARKAKVCVRCEKRIEDGKWVSCDGGRVLCERCWKNMYLPKCRRCNLPIEKQAVSSSDGQLKGKYHRECFNCHTCHKPFPDRSFYVYEGKPLCAYHYHEANDSLCRSRSCGEPIEGPCAVSHSGDRFHPEHLLCEYSGYPRCKEQLREYYEVDGRMLCERHANLSLGTLAEEEEEEDVGSVYSNSSRARNLRGMSAPRRKNTVTRATKRVTRFIDLTGGPGGTNGLR